MMHRLIGSITKVSAPTPINSAAARLVWDESHLAGMFRFAPRQAA
jgi:hypothetical protein